MKPFRKFIFAALACLSGWGALAQISSDPALPEASQKVTISFDSSKESRLGYFTGDLYAHTGLITENSTNSDDWKYVIDPWGDNTVQPKLTNKGNGIYELEITPDIRSFYSAPVGEKLLKLAFVFRSADVKSQTNNLYVDIYEEGLAVQISLSDNSSIFSLNQQITISAVTSMEADITIKFDENILAQNNGTQLAADFTFSETGNHWLIAEATANNETVFDSIHVFVKEDVVAMPKPAAYRKGINYPSDTSAALVLWAPLKQNVFVIGDFNNWELSNDFQMKKDGDYFWLDIPNLEKGKEYIFQYLIDGNIKIADPYTEKISDPWNDRYINDETYPGLISYPENKTSGIASTLQPGQEDYNWEITDFQTPDINKLVIYELLVRDFMEEHTFKAVREKLDYLEDLRINVLELMPVNEFEGNNSWGYNTAFYFAPDKYYGPKNEMKKLIDECHKRGIAVVIDMVLNHSYGQSPFVQMYMDNWTITTDNPWYNVTSPNPVYQWGYDFNHESAATQELVDSVNSFWINEYKVDGFRFDFTKGFTNTPGDGWAYDASRIQILKRMSDEIWNRKDDALVILEHLADNSEEKVLANHGILLWGNMHGAYEQAAAGNPENSDLSWGVYTTRGWNEPNLVTYPESHDEERIMYTIKLSGQSFADYNIRNQRTALDRIELNSLFFLPLPGPKMIWQFIERGYDLSINRCPDGSVNKGCRTDPKPSYWQYLNNADRTDLFKVMAKLNELKQTYEEFTPDNFSLGLAGQVKFYRLNKGNNHVVAVGNFDVTQKNVTISFPATGKWYNFFEQDSIEVSAPEFNIDLAPGEYKLFSTRKFHQPQVITDIKQEIFRNDEISVYPNPAETILNLNSSEPVNEIRIFTATGKLIMIEKPVSGNFSTLNIAGLTPGIYVIQAMTNYNSTSIKFIKK